MERWEEEGAELNKVVKTAGEQMAAQGELYLFEH